MTSKNTRLRRSEPSGSEPVVDTDPSMTAGEEVALDEHKAPSVSAAVGNAGNLARKAPAPVEEKLDFAAMLEQHGGLKPLDLRVGDRVTTRVIRIGKEDVFFDLGPGQDGVMSRGELVDDEGNVTVAEGDEVELFVVSVGATIVLSRRMGRGVDLIGLEQAFRAKMPVEGKVTGVNKGGLDVDVGGARGFCRMGAIDIVHVEDPNALVGQTLTFLITELSEGGRNVVLSRRAVLETERKKEAERLLSDLAVGQTRTGTVTRIVDFGAFIDLGGLDGLVPMGELSWGQVKSASDVVSVGDKVEVEVRRIEDDPKRKGEKRIGLSLRTSGSDPWTQHRSALTPDALLQGTVQKLESFGAFVEVR
ncbi:MAG: 30S ribosomal protein S1, partial [Myxococcota bacterium]